MDDKKIKMIIDMLEETHEKLLSLPDDMLLQIDPRDNKSLQDGLQFISAFNDELDDFSRTSNKIIKLIENHFKFSSESDVIEATVASKNSTERIIAELDKTVPHSLEEDFTYKRPCGFIFGDCAYSEIKTWKCLYLTVLYELSQRDAAKFNTITQVKQFISKRGNPLYSKEEAKLRVASKVKNSNIYVEVNLSSNHIRTCIKDLFSYFKISSSAIKIYLREDRDAGN